MDNQFTTLKKGINDVWFNNWQSNELLRVEVKKMKTAFDQHRITLSSEKNFFYDKLDMDDIIKFVSAVPYGGNDTKLNKAAQELFNKWKPIAVRIVIDFESAFEIGWLERKPV